QLEASLASISGRSSSVIARTGYGKTLCIAIPLLLQPDTITVTISPLKRLQKMQVNDFMQKYGIPTIAINEDTSNSPELWNKIEAGEIRHLLVQPEQLRTNHAGHLPRMARLLHNPGFVNKIKRVAVDEAHNIRTSGIAINGRPPFRPSWGALGEFRARLSKDTSFQALSATMPSFIHRTIGQSLGFPPDSLTIRVSINRPNIIYATHQLIDGRKNLRNLDCIIPSSFHPPMRLPKLVIFHGEKAETCNAAEHLNSLLSPELQKLRICRHYHSDMSPEYLEQTYASFADPEGDVLILHSTSGGGEGLDVREINGVINYGLPEQVTMRFQWEGRAGRSSNRDAFALTMIEPWVSEMDLTDVNPRKQERVGRASVRLAQCSGCKRAAYAKFFEDDDDEALDFTCAWCCDGHPGNGFSLSKLFLGPIYEGEIKIAAKRTRNKYRRVKERAGLVDLLTTWLADTHHRCALRFLRSPSFILDAEAIKSLSMTLPSTFTCAASVAYVLKQSEEWNNTYGESIYEIIKHYNRKTASKKTVGDSEEDSDEDTGPPLKKLRSRS
ncbi:P-loop containing nucleoside triphosphate hydrolase protein, partial [Mycena alexandri]